MKSSNKCLVTGTGSGGTNLVTEYVRALGKFDFTEQVEDRTFFDYKKYPDRYATKLVVETTGFSLLNLRRVLDKNQDMSVVVAVRHPVDCCLSKIYRGLSRDIGGDSNPECDNPASRPVVAVRYFKYLCDVLLILTGAYSDRLTLVNLENTLQHPEAVARFLCDKFGVEYQDEMKEAYKNN